MVQEMWQVMILWVIIYWINCNRYSDLNKEDLWNPFYFILTYRVESLTYMLNKVRWVPTSWGGCQEKSLLAAQSVNSQRSLTLLEQWRPDWLLGTFRGWAAASALDGAQSSWVTWTLRWHQGHLTVNNHFPHAPPPRPQNALLASARWISFMSSAWGRNRQQHKLLSEYRGNIWMYTI